MHPHSETSAKTAILRIVAAAAMLVSGPLTAADQFELAQNNGCFVCHRGAEKRIGPSFRNVAEKYAGQKDAEARLAEHIIKGTGPAGLDWMKEGKANLPFMPANGNVTSENAATLAKWILSITEEVADKAKFVTESISVTGLVAHPLKLGVDDLQKFPQQLRMVPVAGQPGTSLGKSDSFKGVLLRDILKQTAVVSHTPFDVKKMAIIATASDGYKVVFSWSEVFRSPIGEGVMVFFEKNGQSLADDEGRIAIVSANDVGISTRYVKWLKTIEVRKIVD